MSKISMNKFFTALLLSLVVGFGIGYAGAWYSNANRLMKGPIISKQQAANKLVSFIKNNFLSKQDTIKVAGVTEENNLYVLKTLINKKSADFYVTKDGSTFFPEMLDLNPPKGTAIPKTAKPKVDLFVMAFCPYGNDAENQIKPVIDALGHEADFQNHYIIYQNYQGKKYCLTDKMKYCSMHTSSEVREDIRELCVEKYQPSKFWDYVIKINKETNATKVDQDWGKIAKEVGVNISQVKTCQKNEGTKLLDGQIALTKKSYPVQEPKRHRARSGHYQTAVTIQGSPTLVINGVVYDGARTTAGYQKAICAAFKNPPAACQKTLKAGGNNQGSSGTCQ